MTVDEILKTRPYMRWHDSDEYQLSSYRTLRKLIETVYKQNVYVPEDWVDPLRGFVIVSGLDVFIEQGTQHFAYRYL